MSKLWDYHESVIDGLMIGLVQRKAGKAIEDGREWPLCCSYFQFCFLYTFSESGGAAVG